MHIPGVPLPFNLNGHVALITGANHGIDAAVTRALASLDVLKGRYACERCGGLRSIHSGKCFTCDNISSW